MFALEAVGQALQMAFFMFWEVLWPLALGFLISAVVQSLVSKRAVVRVLGREDLRGLTFATLAGAASSSCSYAAVAVARGLVRKGAAFGNAMVFEFASTNLVFELGLVLLVLLGWQFLAAEFAGGLLMIAMLAIAFKYTLRARMVAEARKQADKGLSGRMEGHGAMDMSITDGPFLARLFSGRSLTAVSHYFYMDLASLWQDLLLGFLISGALAAWVPNSFWQALFLTDNPTLGAIWGPVIGPVISMLSFVCSVGNVPLAVVLWNGGISFGGVVSFIFADLIILPILNIYRKYYGGRMSLYLLGVSYAAMVLAGLIVGALFAVFGLVPAHHFIAVFQTRPAWNYTTVLNIAFLILAGVLGWRFLRTGGPEMLRAMEHSPDELAKATTDPVCGMTVHPASAAARSTFAGKDYFFCSDGCKAAFEQDPARYVGSSGAAALHHH
ncbi:MAG: YHS domain-containing protein [Chloroflexi bacterium]|nr:MAG: YHS domain-containing protein [Chloroflexota bacterium]